MALTQVQRKKKKDGGREKEIDVNTGKFCSAHGKKPDNSF
jgi:hypothetical protein